MPVYIIHSSFWCWWIIFRQSVLLRRKLFFVLHGLFAVVPRVYVILPFLCSPTAANLLCCRWFLHPN